MKDSLKYAVVALALAIASGAIYLQYEHTRPCATPIEYRLGTIDARFNISSASLLKDAQAATAIWNAAAHKTLFVYNPKASLPVNLIFDTRQQNTNLGLTIDQEQAAYNAQKASVDAQKAQYESELASYNQQVSYWNSQGGAPRSVYISLQATEADLARKLAALNAAIATLNAMAESTNVQVANYNQTADTTFEEGEYRSDSSGERINIFEFTSQTQLTRVLAHEFGHALGLDHNTDPASIMYPKNTSTNLTPTTADLASLKSLCNL